MGVNRIDPLFAEIPYVQKDFTLYSYGLYQNLKENTPEFSELAAFQPNIQRDSWIVRRIDTSAAAQEFLENSSRAITSPCSA